jgi:hypothetical protein
MSPNSANSQSTIAMDAAGRHDAEPPWPALLPATVASDTRSTDRQDDADGFPPAARSLYIRDLLGTAKSAFAGAGATAIGLHHVERHLQ